MDNIKGIPYFTAEFNKFGNLLNHPSVPAGTTDLIVVSHGWNNDRAAAEELYTKFFGNFADLTANDPAIQGRTFAILGVIWPSKKFESIASGATGVAGGAASAGAGDRAAAEREMLEAIDRVAPIFDDEASTTTLAKLRSMVPQLEDNRSTQGEFVETLRNLLDPEGKLTSEQSVDDASAQFFRTPSEDVFQDAAARPPTAAVTAGDDGVQAAGIGSFFSKAANGVTSLMNLTSYYEMKNRAGTVGKNGLAPLLDKLAPNVKRIHLIGHSFGGRLVTAAAANSSVPLQSLSLLQTAFSHNGFSKSRKGFFRSVIDQNRITGPILVTHTKNDTAVGRAYPTASRISRDRVAGFGDADDEYGAIGSNGAQQMQAGEVSTTTCNLTDVQTPYRFMPGIIHNLESSKYIVDPTGGDAHGWVFVPQVAWAVSRAIVA